MLKYVLKELATPGELQKNMLLIGRKVSAKLINEKIENYAKTFVICKECGKPDTKFEKDEGISFLKCMACGAKHPLNIKI